MSGLSLLETGLLLGLYVALGGSYGLVYAIAHLKGASILHGMSFILYALHGLVAIAIIVGTPLQVGWKGLVVVSSAAFLAIPPITWRFLRVTHETEAQG